MVKRADAGEIVASQRVAIAQDDVALTLHHKLCQAARQLLNSILPTMKCGDIPSVPQRESDSTYYGRRRPEDGLIDWHKPVSTVHNLVRAVAAPGPARSAITARKNSLSGLPECVRMRKARFPAR